MLIVRFQAEGTIRYGVVEGGQVVLLPPADGLGSLKNTVVRR